MIHTDKAFIGTDKVANRTIKLLRTASFAIFASMMLSSCVKDELHNTPHPDRGAVKVTTDWSGISDDATQPDSYLLRVDELPQSVSGATNTFNTLLAEGTYTLLVHNAPHGITVGSSTATVNTLTDGTLEPLPDYLFSAVRALQVIKDDTLRVNVKMMQAGRKLTLVLKLKAGDDERIASTASTLAGIAHTVDLATGTPTVGQTGGTVVPAFVKTTVTPVRAADVNALAATLQPMGVVAGERQLFKMVVTLTDGSTTTVESDLTEALNNFGSGTLPFTLDAELPLPTGGSFSGTIIGWTEVKNDNVTIH